MPDPTPVELVGGATSTAVVSPTFSARAAGELLVLSVAADDYRLTTGTNRPEPSGWTYVDGQQSNLGHYLWFKVCAGGETTVSYAIGSATRSAYSIVSLGTVMDAAPLGVFSSNQSPVTASRGSWTTASITPASGDRWCVVAAIGSTGNNTAGPYTWTAPYSKNSERYHTAGYRPGVTIATQTLSGGTATTATATLVAANSDQATGIAVAFKVAAGGSSYAGSLSASVPRVTASLTGEASGPTYTGTIAATTPRATSAITGTAAAPTYIGSLSGSTPLATSTIAGTVTAPIYTGTLIAAIPPTRANITGTATSPAGSGTLSGTVPRLTGALTGTYSAPVWIGTLNAQLARLTAGVTGVATGPAYAGAVAGLLPRVTATLSGVVSAPVAVGTINAVLPRVTAELTGVVVEDPDYVPSTGVSMAGAATPNFSSDPAEPTYDVVEAAPPTIYAGGSS